MPKPINFTPRENGMLQSQFRTLLEDGEIRYYEGALIQSILTKLELYPTPPAWTEQEQRRVQYQMEKFMEMLKPYPWPYSPLTFGQDTQQLNLIMAVLTRIERSWDGNAPLNPVLRPTNE
jgi:hypothetical protein